MASTASTPRTIRFRTARVNVRIPPLGMSSGCCATGRATGQEELPGASLTGSSLTAARTLATAPASPGASCRQPVVLPVCACLNACDPRREAKLRRATTRSDPPAGPRALPGAAVPQRSPERGRVDPHVIYLSASQPGWDQPAGWFPVSHDYPSELLPAWQRSRTRAQPGHPTAWGGANAQRCRPDCVVSWEYGPATMRALAWARRRRVPRARVQRADALERRQRCRRCSGGCTGCWRRARRFHRGGLAGRGAAAGPRRGPRAGGGGAPERGPERARRGGAGGRRAEGRAARCASSRSAGSCRTRTSTC